MKIAIRFEDNIAVYNNVTKVEGNLTLGEFNGSEIVIHQGEKITPVKTLHIVSFKVEEG